MIKTVGGALWQWDVGREVEITPKPGCTVDGVQFYNGTTESALKGVLFADGDRLTAQIPNIFLQTTDKIYVYAMSCVDGCEYTTERAAFRVASRAKPAGYIYEETEVKTWDELEERVKELEKGGTGGSSNKRIDYVTLNGADWVETDIPNRYAQVVEIESVTEKSQVDLTPTSKQHVIFREKDVVFVAENEGGVVTVYAIGDKPSNDYLMQVTIAEVNV